MAVGVAMGEGIAVAVGSRVAVGEGVAVTVGSRVTAGCGVGSVVAVGRGVTVGEGVGWADFLGIQPVTTDVMMINPSSIFFIRILSLFLHPAASQIVDRI
jgi:UDP-3-O-[3-hydroxymyristoyl] glucosamine N-acyltransferase